MYNIAPSLAQNFQLTVGVTPMPGGSLRIAISVGPMHFALDLQEAPAEQMVARILSEIKRVRASVVLAPAGSIPKVPVSS